MIGEKRIPGSLTSLCFESMCYWKSSGLSCSTNTRDLYECQPNQGSVFLHSDIIQTVCGKVGDKIKAKQTTKKPQKNRADGPVSLAERFGNLGGADLKT